MKQKKTIADRRAEICTPGYYYRRMRYCRRKQFQYEYMAAKPNCTFANEAINAAIRYCKKAEWYRKRLPNEPIVDSERIIDLELTRSRFNTLTANFYGANTPGMRTLMAEFIQQIFNAQVPDEWI